MTSYSTYLMRLCRCDGSSDGALLYKMVLRLSISAVGSHNGAYCASDCCLEHTSMNCLCTAQQQVTVDRLGCEDG